MKVKAKFENIRDKIDGNEVDLSLCNLTEVPVRELVSVNIIYNTKHRLWSLQAFVYCTVWCTVRGLVPAT